MELVLIVAGPSRASSDAGATYQLQRVIAVALRDVRKPGIVRPSFNCPMDAEGIKFAVHPDARLQGSSHTSLPAEVACDGHRTWSFCLATIVKPASSIS